MSPFVALAAKIFLLDMCFAFQHVDRRQAMRVASILTRVRWVFFYEDSIFRVDA